MRPYVEDDAVMIRYPALIDGEKGSLRRFVSGYSRCRGNGSDDGRGVVKRRRGASGTT